MQRYLFSQHVSLVTLAAPLLSGSLQFITSAGQCTLIGWQVGSSFSELRYPPATSHNLNYGCNVVTMTRLLLPLTVKMT